MSPTVFPVVSLADIVEAARESNGHNCYSLDGGSVREHYWGNPVASSWMQGLRGLSLARKGAGESG